MKNNLFTRIIFAILLAFTVNSFVYFGFVNSYSSSVFNYENFTAQFHSGIYQYRILSAQLLLWIYDALNHLNLNFDALQLKSLNSDFDPKMYCAFYLLNTFFLVLTSIVMSIITELKSFLATPTEKILLIAVAIFSIAITQFVVVPYDVSSYFFLLLFFLVFIRYMKSPDFWTVILLVVLMVISTLNRETSALSIALAATLLYSKYGLSKQSVIPVLFLAIPFLAVYLGIRFCSENFVTNDGNLLKENFSQPKNFLGVLFWITFFFFSIIISNSAFQRKNILIFHFFSLPYIIMCFYSGILYEVRLYIPLFLTSLFLAEYNFNGKFAE